MDSYSGRKNFIIILMLLLGLIYVVKLFYLQVIDSSYKLTASNNVLRYITQYPARGLIYDRNGELLVYNEAAYDLMVTPGQLEQFDTIEFCNILNINKQFVKEQIEVAQEYSKYKPSIFLKQVSSLTYARLQEKLYKYPGFFVQPRTVRRYTGSYAAHILGYVGEVDEKTVESNDYYKSGDYIGISGIEKTYEEALRGEKGVNIFLVDVHNRIKGPYSNGRYDSKARMGSNVISSVDADLQAYGEKLMYNKIGSIVAIEPSTGEILALVSAPGYDPELLVGRQRTQQYNILARDTLKPLFNRAVMAQYPPGSTFKLINALIGLQEGVVRPYTEYDCYGGYSARNVFMACHGHKSPVDLVESIQVSCNTYFAQLLRRIMENPKYENVPNAFEKWQSHLLSFGFGEKLNSDVSNELRGIVPTKKYYDRIYGERGWNTLTILSLAIGQGELGTTPLQMANMAATIANRGYYITPHVIKEIEGDYHIDSIYMKKKYTSIDSVYYETVIEGMDLAVNGEPGSGSTARTAHLENVVICGKTGTAENPHGEDHSIFIAFAPKDDPQIAISVYIENGGFGARWAAPTAKLMIEKYLNDSISVPWWEEYIMNADLRNNEEKD